MRRPCEPVTFVIGLDVVHDDRQTGTLARVLGGHVGRGEVSVAVAVKLQKEGPRLVKRKR